MNTTRPKPSRNPWPYAIIAWFIIFGSSLAAWVVVAQRQSIDLVRKDYYEQEVRYQGQLDRMNRTAALRNEVNITYHAARRAVTISLPAGHITPRPTGTIHFYRPSDARLDFETALSVDDQGTQTIAAHSLRGGLWKVKVEWTAASQDYFYEQVIVVDESTAGGIAALPSQGR